MPAILCYQCRKLISDEETRCPYCGAPQAGTTGATTGQLQAKLFSDDHTILKWVLGISVTWYVLSLMLDLESALSFDGGIMAFASPSSAGTHLMGMTGGIAWNCLDVKRLLTTEWMTLISATFLHGSLLHILFNLSWLNSLGRWVVEIFGAAWFLILYISTGITGFLASNIWGAPPTIGASCSIFGLMGALIIFGQRRGGDIGQRLNRQVWAWAIIGFLLGFAMPQINNAGHLGGFVGGMAIALLMPKREGTPMTPTVRFVASVFLVATVISLIGIIAVRWNKPLCQPGMKSDVQCEMVYIKEQYIPLVCKGLL